MGGTATDAFFLSADPGYRFCLLTTPRGDSGVRGAILYVHPFAEEMNKSRRAVAVTARALADNGWAILQVDLLGCGDSSGDFGEASWAVWLDDIERGYHWLAKRFGAGPAIWGLRLGCLLATQSAIRLGGEPDLILWQPVLSGRQHLTQFLRLKAVGDALGDAAVRSDTKSLREQLARGETVQIAGYELTAALAESMDAAELELPAGYRRRVWWNEVGASPGATVAPGSQAKIGAWLNGGIAVEATTVSGTPFWMTQEIAECPELVVATVRSQTAAAV